MSASRQLQAPALTSLRPPTQDQTDAKALAAANRRRRRMVTTVTVFALLATATGLSVYALAGVAAKVAVGAIGGISLAAVAVAPTGRIDP